MLVHLAMMLSTSNGWVRPPDGRAHDSSPLYSAHDSAITEMKSTAGALGGSWRRVAPVAGLSAPAEPALANHSRVCVL